MRPASRTEEEPIGSDGEIDAAIAGDPSARWRAIDACRDYLRMVVWRGGWSRNGAQHPTSDLIQETMLDAWRDFPRFEGRTTGEFRAWLKAILIHGAIKSKRRPPAHPLEGAGNAGGPADPQPSPSLQVQRAATRQALDEAMDGLAERDRVAIHLRLWERSSFERIGAKLNLSEEAARKVYGRAVARLRESMGPGHAP